MLHRENFDSTISSITSSLILLAQEGGDEAWEHIVEIYSSLVLMWCHRAKVPESEIYDIEQEVFHHALKSIEKYRRDEPGHTFRDWLCGITKNRIAELSKKKQPILAEIDLSTFENTLSSEELISDENQVIVNSIIEYLSNNYKEQNWRAYVMVVCCEMDQQIVADELGIKRGQVDQVVSRIQRRLVELGDDLK